MAEDKSNRAYLSTLAAQLNESDLSEIDFDEASEQLGALAERLTQLERADEQYELLREDYRNRIAGMVKAMAAVARSADGLAAAAELIAELPQLSAEELVRMYRRTAVRFRDHFPTSYGPRSTTAGRTLSAAAVNLFK